MSGALAALLSRHPAVGPQNQILSGGVLTLAGNGTTSWDSGTSTPPNWYLPTTANIGSSYWIKCYNGSGPGGNFSAATSFTNISNAGLVISTTGAGAVAGLYQISSNSAGTAIVAQGTISVNSAI